MRKTLLMLLLLVVSHFLYSQSILNKDLVKVGTKWKYSGTIYRTASTLNNKDTTYDVKFDITIQKIIKSRGDTTFILINNFFDNIVFPAVAKKRDNRILVITPKVIFINKFEIDIDKIDTSVLEIKPNLFNVLITKNELNDYKTNPFLKEFKINTTGVVQSLENIKGVNKKSVKLTEYNYVNRRTDISLTYSNEIGFYGYTFDFSGGKATYGSFDLLGIEK